MYLKLRFIILVMLVSLLVSCVSINDKVQLVSNDIASVPDIDTQHEEEQSCQSERLAVKASKSSKSLNPDNISLLNWNIYKGNGEGWQQDLSDFSRNHDLLTIQEATLDEQYLDILEDNDFGWTMNVAFHFNGTSAGVMNIANADSIHSCGFKVNEPIIRIPKSVLISYYAISGSDKKLLVANVHGINFTLGLGSYHEQLDKLYDAIEHHNGPMIVAGDFNSWSDERDAEVNQLISRLSLSELKYSVNNKTHLFGHAIDHVFYRQLDLVSKQVWQVSSSDHNPISVKFRYLSAS